MGVQGTEAGQSTDLSGVRARLTKTNTDTYLLFRVAQVWHQHGIRHPLLPGLRQEGQAPW